MKHVFVYGWCHHGDLDFLDKEGKEDLKFYSGPTLNAYVIGTQEWYDALGAASKVDLAIFAGFGTSVYDHVAPIFRDPIAKQIFDSIPIKVFWSFDTHWQWKQEAQYAHYFDHFYTAHSIYAPLIPGAKHLPVGLYAASYEELHALKPNEPDAANPAPSVVFPTYEHGYGDKDALKELAAIQFNEMGITYCFDQAPDRLDYMRKLMSAKVCLNIPSLGNLNFRAFEAWAVGVPLLTPKSSTFSQFTNLRSRTFFFNRDFSDFNKVLTKSLNFGPTNTQPMVVAKHMIMHRYLEIVNEVFGTHYTLEYPTS